MNNLKDSRIIITGGAGLVGSHTCDLLIKEKPKEIIIIDDFSRGTKENLKEALKSGRVKIIKGDIRNGRLIDKIFKDINYCFHMAALRITQCASEPREALGVMFDGTFNILEACVKYKIKKVILASSASVYGLADVFPTKEAHHPYSNITLYGAAKMANELMFRSFYHMRGLDYIALRYFNIYGPRMDIYGRYTEVLIRWYNLINAGRKPLIYGDGKQTMDFIYVEDVARASVLALKTKISDEVFNIASGLETSLGELCCLLLEVMESNLKPKYISISKDRKRVEVERRWADTSKASKMIGFQAKFNLEEGLKRLIKWLREQKGMEARGA